MWLYLRFGTEKKNDAGLLISVRNFESVSMRKPGRTRQNQAGDTAKITNAKTRNK